MVDLDAAAFLFAPADSRVVAVRRSCASLVAMGSPSSVWRRIRLASCLSTATLRASGLNLAMPSLAEVRRRIRRVGTRSMNEEKTKATLIEPVLRTLGWGVEDVDEVQREFKAQPRHSLLTTACSWCPRPGC